MNKLEIKKTVMITKNVAQAIKDIVEDNPDKYESQNHFIRCAINNFIKQQEVFKNGETITQR